MVFASMSSTVTVRPSGRVSVSRRFSQGAPGATGALAQRGAAVDRGVSAGSVKRPSGACGRGVLSITGMPF